MTQRAIDPIEILTHDRRILKEKKKLPDAWIRFLARAFDYAVWILLLNLVDRIFPIPYLEGNEWVPVPFLLYIPIEALFLMTWGKTLGKWLLKVHLRQGRKRSFDLELAFRRSFNVWFRGIGMGLTFISVLCLLMSYYRLTTFGQTSWDKQEYITVSYDILAPFRIGIACTVIFIVFLVFRF